LYLASDGFEVSDDEYLNSLPSQTLFIVAGPDAVITTGELDNEILNLTSNIDEFH